jgi:archaellum biogenesis ATPase FlaH
MAEEAKEYTEDMQKLYVEFLLSDSELYARCQAIIDSEYFDRKFRKSVKFIQEHVDKYTTVPTIDQLKANTGVEFTLVKDVDERHQEWFLDDFEQFCKHKALANAILGSTDLLEENQFGAVEKIIKDAVQVGLAKNLGTDYYNEPADRLRNLKSKNGGTSTGWTTMDNKLFGGFNKGELNIFAGGSGAGKSIFLQNLALNWSLMGLNVIYLSLELSEHLTAMRMDAMGTGYSTKDLFKNLDDVDLRVKMQRKKAGAIQIVQLVNGCTVNDIRAYLKEYTVQTGIRPDCILVDYLDLMMPAQRKVPPSDLFIKDKFVSEELRNLSVELDLLFATASQLNRGAVDEIEFDHSHIAGGLSKIQTADNVIGIFSSRAMRERGRVQIQFMKTRSSNGVGQKLDLEFDLNTLRISDLPDEEQESSPAGDIYATLKKKSTLSKVKAGLVENQVVEDNVNHSDKLRSMLKGMD